jgi:hypothetical protein
MISDNHAFCLDRKIHPIIQQTIIDLVMEHGYVAEHEPQWMQCPLRSLDRSTMESTENHIKDFHYRLDPQTEWYWEDNEVVPVVRPLIESVEHLYTKLTRVRVFIQLPFSNIITHRDLVSGNDYKFIANAYSPEPGTYCGTFLGHPELTVEPNTRHRDQKYLNLKIPLTTKVGDSGKAFIIGEGSKQYLVANDRFYFLNEYEIFHGCDPVEYHRGIIFVDGILNMEALELEPKLDFQ